jgi:hypothetical protein
MLKGRTRARKGVGGFLKYYALDFYVNMYGYYVTKN